MLLAIIFSKAVKIKRYNKHDYDRKHNQNHYQRHYFNDVLLALKFNLMNPKLCKDQEMYMRFHVDI